MAEDGPPTKKMKLSREDLSNLSKDELIEKFLESDAEHHANATKVDDGEDSSNKESQDRLKEASKRENMLVMRLAAKDQEMQEYVNAIQELKQSQNLSTAQLRSMLLDPAINLMFQRMRKEVDSYRQKFEQAQNDLTAWKFTPDSQTGKRLMARCRQLLQENEDLGKMISSGRTAKLEGEIALEKTLVQEMKKTQCEMDEFTLELDDDMEGMHGTIYLLQQQLKDSREQIVALQAENDKLRNQATNLEAGSKVTSLCSDPPKDNALPTTTQNQHSSLQSPASIDNRTGSPHDDVVSKVQEDQTLASKGKRTSTPNGSHAPSDSNLEHSIEPPIRTSLKTCNMVSNDTVSTSDIMVPDKLTDRTSKLASDERQDESNIANGVMDSQGNEAMDND